MEKISPPPTLSYSSLTSSSSSSSASNLLALCGNFSFQIYFSEFKNALLSRSSSSSHELYFHIFIKISLTIGMDKWIRLRRWFTTTRCSYIRMPDLDCMGSERIPTWPNSDSQSNSAGMCGQNWPNTTWYRKGKASLESCRDHKMF